MRLATRLGKDICAHCEAIEIPHDLQVPKIPEPHRGYLALSAGAEQGTAQG